MGAHRYLLRAERLPRLPLVVGPGLRVVRCLEVPCQFCSRALALDVGEIVREGARRSQIKLRLLMPSYAFYDDPRLLAVKWPGR